MARSQRDRLFNGMARVIARNGYAATTVDDIAAESRVSRKALYTHFSGKEDVLLQAHRAMVERIAAGAGPAIAEQSDWKSALRTLFDWSLELFSREPELASLSLIDVGAATPASRRLHHESLTLVRKLLEQAIAQGSRPVSDTVIDGMLGGMVHVVARAVERGDPTYLPALRPELMAWFVLLLDGPEAAEHERAQPISEMLGPPPGDVDRDTSLAEAIEATPPG